MMDKMEMNERIQKGFMTYLNGKPELNILEVNWDNEFPIVCFDTNENQLVFFVNVRVCKEFPSEHYSRKRLEEAAFNWICQNEVPHEGGSYGMRFDSMFMRITLSGNGGLIKHHVNCMGIEMQHED